MCTNYVDPPGDSRLCGAMVHPHILVFRQTGAEEVFQQWEEGEMMTSTARDC